MATPIDTCYLGYMLSVDEKQLQDCMRRVRENPSLWPRTYQDQRHLGLMYPRFRPDNLISPSPKHSLTYPAYWNEYRGFDLGSPGSIGYIGSERDRWMSTLPTHISRKTYEMNLR